MKKLIQIITLQFILGNSISIQAQGTQELSALSTEAERSLAKGIAFMQSLAIEGGYVYHYSMMEKKNGSK